jgi:hypothetical protein
VRRRWATLGVALGVALGGLLVNASSAQAVWSCHYWRSGQGAYARCDYGLGGVSAWADCPDGAGGYVLLNSPYVPAGQTTAVICRYAPPVDWGYWTWQG